MARFCCRMAGVIALVTLGSVCFAAQLVVIESNSEAFEAGTLVAADALVKLPKGEAVTFLAEDGAIHKRVGPYTGSAIGKKTKKQDRGGLLDAVGKLVGGDKSDTSDVGAVRGGTAAPPGAGKMVSKAPVWALLAHEDGSQCVLRGAPATFWRADADSELRLTLKDVEADRTREIVWAEGQAEAAWPDDVSRTDGASYLVRSGSALTSNRIVIQEIPEALAGQSGAVAWMHAKGCRRQAKALLARLETATQ